MLFEKFENKVMICNKHNKVLTLVTTDERNGAVYVCTECEKTRYRGLK